MLPSITVSGHCQSEKKSVPPTLKDVLPTVMLKQCLEVWHIAVNQRTNSSLVFSVNVVQMFVCSHGRSLL